MRQAAKQPADLKIPTSTTADQSTLSSVYLDGLALARLSYLSAFYKGRLGLKTSTSSLVRRALASLVHDVERLIAGDRASGQGGAGDLSAQEIRECLRMIRAGSAQDRPAKAGKAIRAMDRLGTPLLLSEALDTTEDGD